MLPQSAIAAMLAWNAVVTVPSVVRDTVPEGSAPAVSNVSAVLPFTMASSRLGRDSVRLVVSGGRPPIPRGWRLVDTVSDMIALDTIPQDTVPQDTVPRVRRKSFAVSDAYHTRLTIHRRLSWAMLPLFAASYFSGDQLFEHGSSAPQWARSLHRPAATGAAILFTANTFTGTWNLWESRHNPIGRTRRIVHSVLFTAASAGFVYAGTKLADEAEQSQAKRQQHRNLALASMGVSTVSWLLMLIGN